MKKVILAIIFCVSIMGTSVMTCFADSQVIYSQGAIQRAQDRAEDISRTPVVYSERRKNVSPEVVQYTSPIIEQNEFPVSLGRDTTRVVYLGQNIPFIHVIEDGYVFTRDEKGNIGIAFVDGYNEKPVRAAGGFYIVQKENKEGQVQWVKYCVDNSGYVLFGWIIEENGNIYYLSEDEDTLGQTVTGIREFKDGVKCYFDEDGLLQDIQ